MKRPDIYDYIGMGIVALLIALWVAHFVLPPLPPEPPDPRNAPEPSERAREREPDDRRRPAEREPLNLDDLFDL